MRATVRRLLPGRDYLTAEAWSRRHFLLTGLAWTHLPLVAVLQVVGPGSPASVAAGLAIVAVPAAIASWRRPPTWLREAGTAVALLNASALFAAASTGAIEPHVHFFLIVPALALYHGWWPSFVALVTVLVQDAAVWALDLDHFADAATGPVRALVLRAGFVVATALVAIPAGRLREIETERRMAVEQELREALGVLTTTIEATADGVLVVDERRRWRTYNQRFIDMWRIPDDIARERRSDLAVEHVAPQLEDPEAFKARVDELYADLSRESYDELRFVDGRVFERYSHPHRIDGREIGRVWSYRDVTQQRRDQARLETAVEQLQIKDQLKSVFLTAVSHELRTPLTSVVGLARTLLTKEDELEPALRRNLLERLSTNAERLQALLLDLLDLDRLTRGVLAPNRRDVDLAELAARVVDGVDAGGRDIVVEFDAAPCSVDVSMIERVVENLVVNAVRHTPRGSPVTVTTRRGDDHAEILVADRGPGIPDDSKSAIFEPFRQLATESHAPGTGIGLSLVHEFVSLHGGRVVVEDRPGGGARFRVLLPDDAGADADVTEAAHA